ncbi:MAG: DUF6695 family protein [Flavobacteriales bacterium]
MILKPIETPQNIPNHSQWLAGIGAGSWFCIIKEFSLFKIKRFSKLGVLECSGLFEIDKSGFSLDEQYTFTYLSHCQLCTIIQKNKTYIFKSL